MKTSRVVFGVAVAALLVVAAPADAQTKGRDGWMLPYPTGVTVPTFTLGAQASRAAPGSSSGSQVAYGASWGQAYVGAGLQGRTRYGVYGDGTDGAISAGFGLGNSRDLVGLDISMAMLDLSGQGRVSFGAKLHRALPGNAAIAFGVENAYVTSSVDTNRSYYGVVSKQMDFGPVSKPFSSMVLSLGLGNGRYLLEEDFQADADKVNFFGSVGVRVIESVGFIADWTGQDLALGASIVPFASMPLTITPAFADVTGNAGDGPRFTLGVGMGFQFPNFLQ